MSQKERVSVSADRELIEAGNKAVEAGRVGSFSAWVNEALRRQVIHDQRMKAIQEFVSVFEAEHGEISEAEIRDATRRAREHAVVIRGPAKKHRRRRTSR